MWQRVFVSYEMKALFLFHSNMGTVFLALLLSPVAEKKKPNGFLHSISLILLSASVHSTSGVVLLLTLVHSFI